MEKKLIEEKLEEIKVKIGLDKYVQELEVEGKYWVKTFQENSYYKDDLEFSIHNVMAGVIYVKRIKSCEPIAEIHFSGNNCNLYTRVTKTGTDVISSIIYRENAVEEFDNFFAKVVINGNI